MFSRSFLCVIHFLNENLFSLRHFRAALQHNCRDIESLLEPFHHAFDIFRAVNCVYTKTYQVSQKREKIASRIEEE